jgi:hypothetical protein
MACLVKLPIFNGLAQRIKATCTVYLVDECKHLVAAILSFFEKCLTQELTLWHI